LYAAQRLEDLDDGNNSHMSVDDAATIEDAEMRSPEGSEFVPDSGSTIENNPNALPADVLNAIQNLFKVMGLERMSERVPFNELQRTTQLMKVRNVKKVHSAIYKAVSPSTRFAEKNDRRK